MYSLSIFCLGYVQQKIVTNDLKNMIKYEFQYVFFLTEEAHENKNNFFKRLQTTIRDDINHDKGDKRRLELGGRTLSKQRVQHQNIIIYAWRGRRNNNFDRKAGLTKGKGKRDILTLNRLTQ